MSYHILQHIFSKYFDIGLFIINYDLYRYGLSFGDDTGSNGFVGFGKFMVDTDHEEMGIVFSTYIFHMSFATTATTIVSGAMAERTKLSSYMVLFTFLECYVK